MFVFTSVDCMFLVTCVNRMFVFTCVDRMFVFTGVDRMFGDEENEGPLQQAIENERPSSTPLFEDITVISTWVC